MPKSVPHFPREGTKIFQDSTEPSEMSYLQSSVCNSGFNRGRIVGMQKPITAGTDQYTLQ